MLICIDAGHCLSTPGKRCLKSIDPNETREWVLNSRVADKLEAILAGYSCQTMRVDDVTGKRDVTMSQRVAAANRARADVYLSIHHNAGINGGSGGGIVAFVAPKHQRQSEVVRDAVYRHTVAATGLRGNRAQPLAEQSLYVLNYTTMPATLIELGFMDSLTDTPIILTEEFAAKAAAGLAAALVEVYDLQAKGGGQVLLTAVPAGDLTVELVDRPKGECGDNCANAGYFANYSEAGEPFTLPVGHLVGDYKAAGKWTRHYCQERGRFQGDRFTFDAGKWSYANPLHGKAVSTLLISGGKARVEEIRTVPEGTDYAVSGIPVLRDGKACTTAQAKGQGWDTSPLRATWHTLVGLKGDGMVYVMGWQSRTANLLDSGEAAWVFRGLGFVDVLKLDGGGSYYQSRDGAVSKTAENRRINSVLRWTVREEELEPEPELTEEQAWFDRMMEDWMARKAKEPASQWAQEGLEQAKAKGITEGTRPRSMATREEVALMVNKAVEIR